MRIAAAVVVAALCSSTVHAVELRDVVGLWQFPQKAVWIEIKPNGSAFQCRLAGESTVIVGRGTFHAPGAIAWDNAWGTEQIDFRAGELVVHANKLDKDLRYAPAKGPMSSKCTVVK
jgi:hypothetical protein